MLIHEDMQAHVCRASYLLQKRLEAELKVVDWHRQRFAQVLAEMTRLANKVFSSNSYVAMSELFFSISHFAPNSV